MKTMSTNPLNILETQEIIEKLREAGYSQLVDCLLDNEKDCYTKKGRLNKSSTCRKLKWKGKKLEEALEEMKYLLKNEFDLDIEEQEQEEDVDE